MSSFTPLVSKLVSCELSSFLALCLDARCTHATYVCTQLKRTNTLIEMADFSGFKHRGISNVTMINTRNKCLAVLGHFNTETQCIKHFIHVCLFLASDRVLWRSLWRSVQPSVRACVCVVERTSGLQSGAAVVHREVTLASGEPSYAGGHKARVSGERWKEADGGICRHFWLRVCSGRFAFVDCWTFQSAKLTNNPGATRFCVGLWCIQ